MKSVITKITIVALFLVAVSVLFITLDQKPHPKVVLTGNEKQIAINILPHAYQCAKCKMEIVDTDFASQVAKGDGKTLFFDDIGCMAAWLGSHQVGKEDKIWVYALDTKRWIDANRAYYTATENTPMHYGFGAYEQEKPGTISLSEVIERMRKNEHLANPQYAKKLLKSE